MHTAQTENVNLHFWMWLGKVCGVCVPNPLVYAAINGSITHGTECFFSWHTAELIFAIARLKNKCQRKGKWTIQAEQTNSEHARMKKATQWWNAQRYYHASTGCWIPIETMGWHLLKCKIWKSHIEHTYRKKKSQIECNRNRLSSLVHSSIPFGWDFIEIGMRDSTDGLKRVQSIRSIASLKRQLDRNNLLWLTVTVS